MHISCGCCTEGEKYWEGLPPWSMGIAAKMGVISSSMLVRKQMNVVPAIARTSCNRKQYFTGKHSCPDTVQHAFQPRPCMSNPDVGAMLNMH